ncbi:hypothetical protein [Micromonospora parathelypteridis]|uniref:Uncharacterized protein n=1 Tax=Micromonospora parathelypteridis TaxID=1839617 RepID=A0A840VMQ5_9ACTN|nr:hypothetical protein [Micromonospora parathelypteridis]MBB5477216.1 hypothetical protein [Micromonospora parathelypteridis]GGO08798.1 hypothetical protein GCM10011576_14510 [Micromonospora parathelypteridis]
MNDLDQRIDQTLRERAEGSVDTDRLLTVAVSQGRARIRRRRTVAGIVLGVVAVLGAGAAIGPVKLPESGPGVVLPGPGLPADPVVRVLPPRADGVPGAAARPDRVGADPDVLHFGFAPDGPRYLSWSVQSGVEMARLDVGGRTVTLELAASADALPRRAQGLPALVPELVKDGVFDGSVSHAEGPYGVMVWLRHWQPAPGVYARASVNGADERDLFDVAAALRLDQAHRCGGPLRLTALPAGTQISRCEVTVAPFPAAFGVQMVVSGPTPGGIQVELQYATSITDSRTGGNRTIGGKLALIDSQSGKFELLGFPKAHLTADFGWPVQGYTEDDAAVVLGGAQVAEHLDQPTTW